MGRAVDVNVKQGAFRRDEEWIEGITWKDEVNIRWMRVDARLLRRQCPIFSFSMTEIGIRDPGGNSVLQFDFIVFPLSRGHVQMCSSRKKPFAVAIGLGSAWRNIISGLECIAAFNDLH